ncbi:MAG: hypothetical protein ACD_33C00004G0006, partial [uncultured bacterium]
PTDPANFNVPNLTIEDNTNVNSYQYIKY